MKKKLKIPHYGVLGDEFFASLRLVRGLIYVSAILCIIYNWFFFSFSAVCVFNSNTGLSERSSFVPAGQDQVCYTKPKIYHHRVQVSNIYKFATHEDLISLIVALRQVNAQISRPDLFFRHESQTLD